MDNWGTDREPQGGTVDRFLRWSLRLTLAAAAGAVIGLAASIFLTIGTAFGLLNLGAGAPLITALLPLIGSVIGVFIACLDALRKSLSVFSMLSPMWNHSPGTPFHVLGAAIGGSLLGAALFGLGGRLLIGGVVTAEYFGVVIGGVTALSFSIRAGEK